jgi:outer membrane receptor protein involved in Fe transport
MNITKLTLLGGVANLTIMSTSLWAQDRAEATRPEEAVTQVGEIVVTALRRDQRLQEVPAAVSVLEGEVLKAKGAQDLRDYLATAPGVNFTESPLGAMRVTIRGVSDGIGATDPLTGIYIDETPITESFQATLDPDIYDVDRVEVLKGPQGTLYGSGSMGGTVRIIGRKPRLNAYEASLGATAADVAHGGTNIRVDGVVNLPLVDDLMALRVSAGYRKDAGWIDDVLRGEADGNDVEKQNLRAQLLLTPGPDTDITLGFLYQKDERGLPWFDDLNLPNYETARVFRQGGGSEARLYSLTLRQNWDRMALTAATNYLSKNGFSTLDSTTTLRGPISGMLGVTLGADEGVGVKSLDDFSLFTQEVRLSSTGENRIDWLVGGFYSNGSTKFPQVFDFSQAPTATAVMSGGDFYTSVQRYDTRQTAVFGELTFNATDKLSLTAGLRGFNVNQRNVTRSSGLFNGGTSSTDMEADISSSTAKLLAKYQIDRDHMVYAQAVQGYRNGGPTGNVPLAACSAALTAAGYSSVPTAYGADKLWNYELGSKNSFMNGRMQLNGSAFYIDWSDIQSTIGLACGFSFVTNAGKAVSTGLELETVIRPIEGLTLTGSTAYVDAELTEAAAGTVARVGDPLPLTSKWSWSAGATYERDLTQGLTGFIGGDVSYVGERWNTFRSAGPARATLMDGYTLVSARIGVRKDNWTLSLFGTNLTDEHVVNNVNGLAYETVGRPRTIGVSIAAHF